MKVLYSKNYNIDLGFLNYLHPFDGTKFRKIYENLLGNRKIEVVEPLEPVSMAVVDEFLTSIMQHRVRNKNGICQALEIPRLPFVRFSWLDKKVLLPMRWGVAGTLLGTRKALQYGGIYWNLAGGYHHAMQQNMEGFCIYNDIGICYQQLIKEGVLTIDDKILIIDTDAHHGNGNSQTFINNPNVHILDIYNSEIYPTSSYSRERVDFPVPLASGTRGKEYLERYRDALERLDDNYKIAFVVAGTDVLASDKLGGLKLAIEDVVEREKLTIKTLSKHDTPTVLLGGGGYSKESAVCVTNAILACSMAMTE